MKKVPQNFKNYQNNVHIQVYITISSTKGTLFRSIKSTFKVQERYLPLEKVPNYLQP